MSPDAKCAASALLGTPPKFGGFPCSVLLSNKTKSPAFSTIRFISDISRPSGTIVIGPISGEKSISGIHAVTIFSAAQVRQRLSSRCQWYDTSPLSRFSS